jgi:integrase
VAPEESTSCATGCGGWTSRSAGTRSRAGAAGWPGSSTGPREDAEIALARLKVADHEKRLPSGGTSARSVRAAFQLYLQAVDSGLIELAPATVVTCRSASKRMCSTVLADGRTFGDIRLSRLNWSDIESLYAAMRVGGYGPAWVRRCATVLTRALELARKRGLIDANPSKDAARPRTVRSKPFAPTGIEVRELLAATEKRDAEAADAAVVLASTGIRKGELLAIRWIDVDFDAAEMHISAAITDGGRGVGVVRKSTKRSDWRDVPLTSAAADALRRQATRRRKLIGVEPAASEFVFPAGIDRSVPMRPDALSDRGRQRGEVRSFSSSTSAITRRPRCSTPASRTERSLTSSATASPPSGFITTVAPTSANERRSRLSNSTLPRYRASWTISTATPATAAVRMSRSDSVAAASAPLATIAAATASAVSMFS